MNSLGVGAVRATSRVEIGCALAGVGAERVGIGFVLRKISSQLACA